MDVFNATRCEAVFYSPLPSAQERGTGFTAPGQILMVLREGAGWVRARDGSARPVAAPGVVTWSEGEWVEYGTNGSCAFSAELYWAAGIPEQQRAALEEAFASLG